MRNAVTTGITGNGTMDSDSVNLGSNPSPPATEILEISSISAPGQIGQDGQSAPLSRTQPGTVVDDEVARLNRLGRRHPHLQPHIRKLVAALRKGDTALAGKLANGLQVAMVTVTGGANG